MRRTFAVFLILTSFYGSNAFTQETPVNPPTSPFDQIDCWTQKWSKHELRMIIESRKIQTAKEVLEAVHELDSIGFETVRTETYKSTQHCRTNDAGETECSHTPFSVDYTQIVVAKHRFVVADNNGMYSQDEVEKVLDRLDALQKKIPVKFECLPDPAGGVRVGN